MGVNIKPHVVGTNRREHSRPLSLYDPPCMVIFDGECIDDHGTKGASISRSVRGEAVMKRGARGAQNPRSCENRLTVAVQSRITSDRLSEGLATDGKNKNNNRRVTERSAPLPCRNNELCESGNLPKAQHRPTL